MRRSIVVGALIFATFTGGALAQAPTAPGNDAQKLIGASWEFSNADRDKVCTVTFKSDTTANGFKLEFDRNCANLFPLVKDIEAWSYPDNDLLRLVDARGKPLVEFSEVESGIYEAPTPGVGVLFLQAAGTATPVQRTAEQMFGDWTIMRSDKPLCTLTLSSKAVRDSYALTIKQGCDPAIARTGFATWQMDQGELVLQGARGTSWRFEEGEATWRRVPETPEPITLVRQ